MNIYVKRSLLLVLCLTLLMGTCLIPLGVSAAETEVNVQNGTGTRGAVEVTDSMSYRAIINGAFTGFGICIPTYTQSDSACTLSVYAWKGTFEATMGADPLASRDFVSLKDCAWNWVEFEALPAGEYLFHISNVQSKVGVWVNSGVTDPKGFLYTNGVEGRGEPDMKIRLTESVTDPFGICKSSVDIPTQISPVLNGEDLAVSQISKSEGIILNMALPFVGVEFRIATYLATDLEITLSLYEWNKSFEDTVQTDPVAEERIPMKDNAYIGMTFEERPAGQYLALLHDASGKSAVYHYGKADGINGIAYKDGAKNITNTQYLQCRVTFVRETESGVYFLPCEKVEDGISGDHAAPPAYIIPEDSLLNTHTVMPDTWVFTDGLGRVSLTNAEVGDPKDDKTLAMFFWIWHGSGESTRNNLQELSEQYPDAMRDYDNPLWSQLTGGYSWNESIYGYYNSSDAWVLRRQAELLANAGVDVIVTDNTNGTDTFRTAYTQLFDTWDDAQKNGAVNVPKVAFMLPFDAHDDSRQQFNTLYLDIYRSGKWQNLWYYHDGKPLIVGHADNLSAEESNAEKEILNFFTFRENYAGYTNKKPAVGSWGWLSTFPQSSYYGSREDVIAKLKEQISVSVAQNYNYELGLLAAMNGDSIMGRSYTSTGYHTEAGAKLWGYNFAEQFNYALEVNPQVVFVTGWNEWMVGRYETWIVGSDAAVENAFPDQFNDEYSRDIEPSKGDLKDHYYYQLVNFVRQYKGVNPIPTPSAYATIDLSADPDQWKTVEPYYAAYIGNTDDRNCQGYGQVYAETSGRNDIIGAQIARDGEYVYFHVECAENITPYTDKLWMNLYLDTDQSNQGWNTFEYVLNKSAASAETLVLEKFTAENDYSATTKVADVEYRVDGRYMTVKIAKSDLGLSGDDYIINFSWTDNVHDEGDYSNFSGDIMDFYISGDVAPGGRFKYSYISTADNAMADETEGETASESEVDSNTEVAPESSYESLTETTAETTDEIGPEDDRGCASAFGMSVVVIAVMATIGVLCLKKE